MKPTRAEWMIGGIGLLIVVVSCQSQGTHAPTSTIVSPSTPKAASLVPEAGSVPPMVAHMATQADANHEAVMDGLRQGFATQAQAIVGKVPASETVDTRTGLPIDHPFPANGTGQLSFKIAADQPVSTVTAKNLSSDNLILLWYINIGDGDREAARLYIRAGQSGRITLPSTDYRMAGYSAPSNLGLDRGFGSDARMRDFGFVDMKTSSADDQFVYQGYGLGHFHTGGPTS